MISETLKERLQAQLRRFWRNSLVFGPVPYSPPTKEQAEKLDITFEEAVDLYDSEIKRSPMVEISPGLFDYKGVKRK